MFSLLTYEPGKGLRRIEKLEAISDLIAESKNVVWLDAMDPSREEMDFLAREFGFHPLAIEDYFSPHHRPKVDEYPGYYFVVTHSVSFDSETAEVRPLELDIFMGKNYIVTLHREDLPALGQAANRWRGTAELMQDGTGLLLYEILDGLVDSYFPVLDEIDLKLDQIEDDIFTRGQETPVEDIFRLKRALVVLRRIAAPLRDTFNTLTRREQPLLSEHAITYLRDIYDHTLRIVDMIDTYRDVLTGALDAYLTVISNQLNSVMKTLTVAATVLISIGLVSGIYGMNFRYMPEIGWRYGYPAALGAMAAIALSLLYYFKRRKWL